MRINSTPYLARVINPNNNTYRLKIESEITKQNKLARFKTCPDVRKLLMETVGSIKLRGQVFPNSETGIQIPIARNDGAFPQHSYSMSSELVRLYHTSSNRLPPMV